jgi:hypothetical protein
MPPASRRARCALTAPFHPYPTGAFRGRTPGRSFRKAVSFLWHCPGRELGDSPPANSAGVQSPSSRRWALPTTAVPRCSDFPPPPSHSATAGKPAMALATAGAAFRASSRWHCITGSREMPVRGSQSSSGGWKPGTLMETREGSSGVAGVGRRFSVGSIARVSLIGLLRSLVGLVVRFSVGLRDTALRGTFSSDPKGSSNSPRNDSEESSDSLPHGRGALKCPRLRGARALRRSSGT